MEPCHSNIMLKIRELILVMGEKDCLVKQLLMPKFCGKHPPIWISRMERFCCANKYTEDEKWNMILRSMQGDAIIWYTEEISTDAFLVWSDFTRRLVVRFLLDNNHSPPQVISKKDSVSGFKILNRYVCVSELIWDTQSVVAAKIQDEEMVHKADYILEEESCEAESSNLAISCVSAAKLVMQMTKSSCEYLEEDSWSCANGSVNSM